VHVSYEIVLLAGEPGEQAALRRSALVEHAARCVPGAGRYELLTTSTTAVALVATIPAGGSAARLEATRDGLRAVVAVTAIGLDRAWREAPLHEFGSETAHVRVDVHNDKVTLRTDGNASVPAFWAVQSGTLFVSTHLASIASLGAAVDPDDQGVIEYLAHLHPWGSRTLIDGVSLLPPGGAVHWRMGCEVVLTAQPLYVASNDSMGDDEAVGIFAELWRDVVGEVQERGAGRRTAVGLSGGLDSRAIVHAAVDNGWEPMTYSYGTLRCEETAAAREVAERLQLNQVLIPVTEDRLIRNPTAIADTLDGAHTPAEMYELWFDDTLHGFADVIVNGLAGGTMFGDEKAMGITSREAIAHQVLGRYAGDAAAAAPFVTLDDGTWRAAIRGGVYRSFESWDFAARADEVMFWRHANRMVRWGNMLTNSLRRRGLTVEVPFLDRRFVTYAARLTPAQRLNGNLYLRVHQELFDRTADARRGDDGNSPRRLNHVYWSGDRPYGRQMAELMVAHPVSGFRRGLRRTGDVIAPALVRHNRAFGISNRWQAWRSVFPAKVWAANSTCYRGRLADMLEEAIGARSVLDDDAIANQVERLRDGDPPTAPLILSRVGTVGYWLNDYRRRACAVTEQVGPA
jgi:asparagine synthase (glutamine-hydrolysing)